MDECFEKAYFRKIVFNVILESVIGELFVLMPMNVSGKLS